MPEGKGFDVGINVTSVVSTFVGNDNNLDAKDLPVFLRWTNKNSAIRLGLGARGFTTEFLDNVSGSFRTSKQNEFATKFGIEVTRPVDNRWQFYYGVDLIANLNLADVESQSSQFFASIEGRTISTGLSVFTGIRYFLGDRFYLSTETNMSYIYNLVRTTETFFNGGANNPVTSNTQSSDFSLNPPLFIYVNYRLR